MGDSFGTRYVTRGLVRLLGATVPVPLLRSGTGAIGAISHGAHAGALATSSGLFVSALLGHHRQSVLARIADRTPALGRLWPCYCPECQGAVPTHLDPDVIYRHSLHTQLSLADELCHLRHAPQEPKGRVLQESPGDLVVSHHVVSPPQYLKRLRPPMLPNGSSG